MRGLRLLREELEALMTGTLMGVQRVKLRRALDQVEQALEQQYQVLGEQICHSWMQGEIQSLGRERFRHQFAEIERLQVERQRLLEEIKGQPE